jgi:hypothetical protein
LAAVNDMDEVGAQKRVGDVLSARTAAAAAAAAAAA